MPSSTVLRPDRSALTRRSAGSATAVAAAAAILLAALWGPLEPPPTVDLRVDNPTQRDIHVSIRSQGDRGIVGLGTVGRDGTTRFREVVEIGDTWVIAFSSGGVDGGEIVVTRSQLAEDDWTVSVPAALDQELADAGVPPSA